MTWFGWFLLQCATPQGAQRCAGDLNGELYAWRKNLSPPEIAPAGSRDRGQGLFQLRCGASRTSVTRDLPSSKDRVSPEPPAGSAFRPSRLILFRGCLVAMLLSLSGPASVRVGKGPDTASLSPCRSLWPPIPGARSVDRIHGLPPRCLESSQSYPSFHVQFQIVCLAPLANCSLKQSNPLSSRAVSSDPVVTFS